MASNTAQVIMDEFESLRTKRSIAESHWRDIASVLAPDIYFNEQQVIEGKRERDMIFDSTGIDAVERLTAAMHSFSVSAGLKWFSVRDPDDDIDENPQVREWMHKVTEIMLAHFASTKSGWNSAATEIFESEIVFGTGAMFIDPPQQDGALNDNMYVARPLTEIFLAENDRAEVDTVYRRLRLSPRQAVQRYGESVDASVSTQAGRGGTQAREPEEYIHAVYPRDDRAPDLPTPDNMPWASVTVHQATGTLVKISGFRRNPYATPRWKKRPGQVYGRGPGHISLAEVMTKNVMERDVLTALNMEVRPPLQGPYDGFIHPVNINPGDIVWTEPGTAERLIPIFSGTRFDAVNLALAKREEKIRLMFLLDLLELPLQDRMTTAEVTSRRTDRMQLLSPVLYRQSKEFLNPVVVYTFNDLKDAGRFPEMPEELEDHEIAIDYTSPLFQAQKASEQSNISRALGLIGALAEGDPKVLMNFDSDALSRHVWTINNNDPRFLVDADEVASKREKIAQLESAQQEAQVAETAGGAAKNVVGALQGGRIAS